MSDGGYVGKHAGPWEDEPDPPHYSWWEVLRDHWYIFVILAGLNVGSRLVGVPRWLGTSVGIVAYAAAIRGWRWWRRRRASVEDPPPALNDLENGVG